MSKSRDVAIFVLKTMTMTATTQPITLPLDHAHGVIMSRRIIDIIITSAWIELLGLVPGDEAIYTHLNTQIDRWRDRQTHT